MATTTTDPSSPTSPSTPLFVNTAPMKESTENIMSEEELSASRLNGATSPPTCFDDQRCQSIMSCVEMPASPRMKASEHCPDESGSSSDGNGSFSEDSTCSTSSTSTCSTEGTRSSDDSLSASSDVFTHRDRSNLKRRRPDVDANEGPDNDDFRRQQQNHLRPKRLVRFFSAVKVHSVETMPSTEEEKSERWYLTEELRRVKREAMIEVAVMQGRRQVSCTKDGRYITGWTSRGIENMKSSANHELVKVSRRIVITAVLAEQERQRELHQESEEWSSVPRNPPPPSMPQSPPEEQQQQKQRSRPLDMDAISSISCSLSKDAKVTARRLGQIDESFVQEQKQLEELREQRRHERLLQRQEQQDEKSDETEGSHPFPVMGDICQSETYDT